jgi:peptidoglycan/xylan/chitin deacetylase (PgdA/CDA1 family)
MQVRPAVEVAKRIRGWIGGREHDAHPSLIWPGGVVSFSFDDFPRSALLAGGRILEDHGARGTYYAAADLTGTHDAAGLLFRSEDLRRAHERGHEIGCHTYSHLNCAKATEWSLRREVRKNAEALSWVLDGFTPINFAYPFGAASPRAKRLLGRRFASCRGIQPGINKDALDLGELRANRIYDHDFDEARMHRLIDENRALGGWLIFYTHDVGAAPSRYGCRPAQLGSVVAYAARNSPILPVRDVVSAANVQPDAEAG